MRKIMFWFGGGQGGPGIHYNVQSGFNLTLDSLLYSIKEEEGEGNKDGIEAGVCVRVHTCSALNCFFNCLLLLLNICP